MTDIQFLELLKREFAAFYKRDGIGRCKSTLGVLELIETYKKQIQDETIKEFISTYRTMVPNHQAKTAAARSIKTRDSGNSARSNNPEKPLVICR